MNFSELAKQKADYIISLRRYFHQNPEVSLREAHTTDAIEKELISMGIPCTRFDGCLGVMGTITGKHPGKTVLLRADIDALPIREQTCLPYASVNGAMHACGHDCHMAMLLGAAKLLQDNRENLHGSVRVLFQSAEELLCGAEHYVVNGCLNGVDAVFGMHIWSDLQAPLISVEAGPRMAACDNFELIIYGVAAHGATPHRGNDAIAAAATAIMQLQGYVSRCHDTTQPLVITIGTIHGGQQSNIIADRVVITGTARCFGPELRSSLEEDLRELFAVACKTYHCTAKLIWKPRTGAVINRDDGLVNIGQSAVRKLYGQAGLGHQPPVMISEDFACYGEQVPSLFCFLGGGNPEIGANRPHHSSCFKIDESVLPRGAALYAQLATDFLSENE